MDIFFPVAEQCLEDGTVLAVHGKNLDMVFLRFGHDNFPCRDQGLLIGKSNVFSRLDRGEGRDEADRTDNGRNDLIDFRVGGGLNEPFYPVDDFNGDVRKFFSKGLR